MPSTAHVDICMLTPLPDAIHTVLAAGSKGGEMWEHACASGLAAACCLGPCYAAAERGELRRKYNLQGSRMEDCMCTLCCSGLALCQATAELRELDKAYVIPHFPAPAAAPVAAAAPVPAAPAVKPEGPVPTPASP
jgi:Cys-rich protein (TIGR01571 family)